MKTGAQRRRARKLRHQRLVRTPGSATMGPALYWLAHGLRWLAQVGAAALADRRLQDPPRRANDVFEIREVMGPVNIPDFAVRGWWPGGEE